MHFGVAAAKQALADSGFEITDENREDVGVVFGSGAGGQQLMIDAWIIAPREGPAERRADVHRQRPRRLDVGHDRDRDRRDRPQRLHRVGLRDRHPQRRRGGRGDPARRLHRGHLRLDRGAAARGRLMPASRTCAGWACPGPASRSRRVSPAVRQDARRVRPRRGRRRPVPRGPRAGQGARREDLRRGRRLRLGGRRLGHDPADRAAAPAPPGR